MRFLFQQGEMVTTTQSLTDDMIELFAAEVGADVRLVDPGEEKEAELQAKYFDDEDEDEELPPAPPARRHRHGPRRPRQDPAARPHPRRPTWSPARPAASPSTSVPTRSIYQDQLITFIDTPGHEAFTAMRARGAEVTDIVILVVAADDGVMPQTIEAINHAKAADVPIVVAVNKIDRDNADPNRVMQQLSEQGLVPEAWGGDTIMVEISALQNFGIDDLLEQVLVVAELEELVANPEGRARGVVLEANLDPGKGPVATVIVQSGTLRVGDPVVAGAAWGRVKALIDDKGDNVKEAPPSTPVQVLGFDSVPAAGDEFRVTDKSKTARDIAEQREQRYRAADQRRTSSATGTGAKLEDIFEQIQRGETATLNLVLKADVQGSLEAVTESLRKLERDEVKLSFVHRAVGGITENDVSWPRPPTPPSSASTSAPTAAPASWPASRTWRSAPTRSSTSCSRTSRAPWSACSPPSTRRSSPAKPRSGRSSGCPASAPSPAAIVRNGVITRGSKVRFLRDGVIIWKGAITSLKRFKDDVREVHENFECGIGLSNNQDLQEGDIIETFEEREIPRT